ncbi:MAG: HD domain-containing protein [Bdellovibrio sp.]|nr:MAG: HD domain-containing protein [Bdellovibrio sp.]
METEIYRKIMKSPPFKSFDFLSEKGCERALQASKKLSQHLLEDLQAIPGWEEAEPIALGSFAREELCAHSDIDLLFVGSENVASTVIRVIQEKGLRVRCRMPQNPDDWTRGVEDFDILALMFGRPLSEKGKERFLREKKRLWEQKRFRRQIFRSLLSERDARKKKHHVAFNSLEPHLKYGPGGLRDVQQALYVFELFPEKQQDFKELTGRLQQLKSLLLAVRHLLHFYGGREVLSKDFQEDIACFFDLDPLVFMQKLQQVLYEAHFLSDVIIHRSKMSDQKYKEIQALKLSRLVHFFQALERFPVPVMEYRIAKELRGNKKKWRRLEPQQWGKVFYRYWVPTQSAAFFQSLFRSGLLSFYVRDLKRVSGMVLHDQYHRYPVDRHLLQCALTLKELCSHPRRLGQLKFLNKELTNKDWRCLLWVCLFHDLGKGLKGDHSQKGKDLVRRHFKRWGIRADREMIEALVYNHLLLARAAFRRNPLSPETWRWLHQHGVKGRHLRLLATFTVVDILATNPEAWNSWKESLLARLIQVLRQPEVPKVVGFFQKVEKQFKQKEELAFFKRLEISLIENLPHRVLLEDAQKVLRRTVGEKDPLVIAGRRKGELWIRFYKKKDREGLFLHFVKQLYEAGCGIQEAFVHTYEKWGVYDWFKVTTLKTAPQFGRLLGSLSQGQVKKPQVHFSAIEKVSEDSEEVVVSFTGNNQKGALLAAAWMLFEQGLSIRWARVHTWGRQIDDTFGIVNRRGVGDKIQKLIDQSV